MELVDVSPLLGPSILAALEKKGYTSLTPVQQAVLDPALTDRDLRISSQTGSGKTLAIGFALRALAHAPSPAQRGIARPNGMVVTPTRELAKQVEAELSWLYASSNIRVACVSGGANYRDEERALARGPALLVGTPGRLLDHLRRGAIDPGNLGAVVLDEADRMLDLGFRDDLEAILALAPEGHRTHLVSATFAREVQALANRVQREPVHVQGTPLGTANTDIEHIVHLVAQRERVDALVNLLLADPDAQTLIFAKTRADVAGIADELHGEGFLVDSLSGDMDQPARNRALAGFKAGKLHALVATDVAARGIDHRDIARVIQIDPPTDADTYTHRSGRTGRAGRKGRSVSLVTPTAFPRLSGLLKRAGVRFKVEAIPTAESIAAAQDERLFLELTADLEAAGPDDPRMAALVQRIAESGHSTRALERLLLRTRRSAMAEPRVITPLSLNAPSKAKPSGLQRAAPVRSGVAFHVSFGEAHGADARRLLAMLCRRGNIRGSDIGAIRIMPKFSIVEVAPNVADAFEQATRAPDPRDPRISIRRDSGAEVGARAPARAHAPVRHAPKHAPTHAPKAAPKHKFGKAPRERKRPD